MIDKSDFSERQTNFIIYSLLLVMPVVGMAVDLIAPSLPAIAHDLKVSPESVKNIISIYLLGYAFGSFFIGFLTDTYGRRNFLRGLLLGFIIASSLPLFFPSITTLLICRFFQGLTLGGVALVARSICSDILSPSKLISFGILIGTLWGIGPVIGPVLGGYLQFYFGWTAGFYFFTITTILLFILLYLIVPETHFKRTPFDLKVFMHNLILLCKNGMFMALVLLMGLAYSLVIVFNTIAPFLIQNHFNYDSVFFGHLAFMLGIVFLISTIISRTLLKFFTVENIYFISINIFFIIALILLIVSYYFPTSIMLVGISSALMFFATGLIFPMSMGKGISLFQSIAGTAGAVMYFINISITSASSFLVSTINVHNAIPLLWVYFILMFTIFVLYWVRIHGK